MVSFLFNHDKGEGAEQSRGKRDKKRRQREEKTQQK